MVNRTSGPLRRFLVKNEVGQNTLARGIYKSSGYLSQLANDAAGASQDTVDAILAYLSDSLSRKVTYEEVFGGRRVSVRINRAAKRTLGRPRKDRGRTRK